MRTDALEEALTADRDAGYTPIAIVATAGTVVSGTIDPTPEIVEVAKREDFWLHVDGAYGRLAAIALPDRFDGISAADSVSLDAQKWLYQPLDCGYFLHRHPQVARATFSNSDDYVKNVNDDPTEAFAFFDESMELSRRFRALKLWMSLQYRGREAFRRAINADIRHAQLLAHIVGLRPELELCAAVSLSAVCFRHRTKDNQALLKRVIDRGHVYLSNATIQGQFVLRACIVNHRTTEDDVRLIISEVLAAANDVE